MGLGKTMQAITAMRLLVHHGQLRRVLLVCPKPLVTNWQREFAQWAPELPVDVDRRRPGAPAMAVANRRRRRDDRQLRNGRSRPRRRLPTPTTITTLSCSMNRSGSKTPRARRTKSFAQFRAAAVGRSPARRSKTASTTCVGIFEFVAPGQLDAKDEAARRRPGRSDYVLRRTKDQVLTDLPPKLFRDADLELSPEQAESYRLAEDEGVVRLREMKHELTIQHVFELVLRLKQICNFDPATGASSKFERLEADLEECAASGRKAIVFSQWVQTLAELRTRLARFGPGRISRPGAAAGGATP